MMRLPGSHSMTFETGEGLPTFTPPYVTVKSPDAPEPFNRLGMPKTVSVIKNGSSYRQVNWPTDEDVATADAAYLGGRTYGVSEAEAAALTAAGYTVTP